MVMKYTFCLLVGIFGATCFGGAIGVSASPIPPAGAVFSAPLTINGVVFEAWVSSHSITLPKHTHLDRTFMLGLRITNHTRQPLRFSAYDGDMPFAKIVASNGSMINVDRGEPRAAMRLPNTTDYLLARPGQSITIAETGESIREGKAWRLIGADNVGALWECRLRPGNYRLLLFYCSTHPDINVHLPSSDKQVRLTNVWTGTVKTNPVSFRLVNK